MSPVAAPVACGYHHPDYARSLAEFGRPKSLGHSGGWLLERDISGTNERDLAGCYPLFTCGRWSELSKDVNELLGQYVSLALVLDPLAALEVDLDKVFDIAMPFKPHFLVDFRDSSGGYACKHHRYYARKALQQVSVDMPATPDLLLDEWEGLYAVLSERHGIEGMRRFSRQAFRLQLTVPGLVVFRASSARQTVAAHLWYVQDDIAFSHLAAANSQGYELMAAYALYAAAIEYFRDKVRWMELGGGAGIHATDGDGLAQFKRGWANAERPAFACGRVLDSQSYERLCARHSSPGQPGYFPAYRSGESW